MRHLMFSADTNYEVLYIAVTYSFDISRKGLHSSSYLVQTSESYFPCQPIKDRKHKQR